IQIKEMKIGFNDGKIVSQNQITPTSFALVSLKKIVKAKGSLGQRTFEQKDLVVVDLQEDNISVNLKINDIHSFSQGNNFLIYKEQGSLRTKIISSENGTLAITSVNLEPMMKNENNLGSYKFYYSKKLLIGYDSTESRVYIFAKNSSQIFIHKKTYSLAQPTLLLDEPFIIDRYNDTLYKLSTVKEEPILIQQEIEGHWEEISKSLIYQNDGSGLKIAKRNSEGNFIVQHNLNYGTELSFAIPPHLIKQQFLLLVTRGDGSYIVDLKAKEPHLTKLDANQMSHFKVLSYKKQTYLVLYGGTATENSFPLVVNLSKNPIEKTKVTSSGEDLENLSYFLFPESIYFSEEKLHLGGAYHLELLNSDNFFGEP
ncbi:MAG: hypothetical protein VX642_11020, partial [Bdellovibrionota bacterium]|nr:hypothetical protein [Bdellovibrionota bacterium]